MKNCILAISLLAFAGCSKSDGTTPTNAPANTPANTPTNAPADAPTTPTDAGDAKKSLLDKAKEAVNNVKQGATTPLTSKAVTDLLGVANDLKLQLATAAGQVQNMSLETMIAKAKDLGAIAEKHGFKTSELTGLVTRVGAVMTAISSGNIPDNLKADAQVLEQFKAQLQALFTK